MMKFVRKLFSRKQKKKCGCNWLIACVPCSKIMDGIDQELKRGEK